MPPHVGSGSGRTVLAFALLLSWLGAALEQVLHEVTHGLVALLVGKRWVMLNLFASASIWPEGTIASARADGLVAGSAAIVNIACGLGCVALFHRPLARRRPVWRLALLYFGAFSLMAGFGYLMTDAIFFNPARENLGDWKKVLALLGGGWGARAPILVAGAAGTLFTFLWLPRAALRFVGDPADRAAVSFRLLLAPFVVVNGMMTVLALWHPLGVNGLALMGLKYWMGYSALLWGAFIAGKWAKVELPLEDASVLPASPGAAWIGASAAMLTLSVALLASR